MGQSVNLIEYIDELIGDDYVSYSELLEVQKAIEYINEDGYEHINGRITWSDNNNEDGNRPSSVMVNCYNGSTKIKTVTTSESNNWEYNLGILPSFDSEHERINYTVTIDSVTDYTPVITGYNITMNYTRDTKTLTVSIIWDDNNDVEELRPNSVTATLSDNSTVTLNSANNWSSAVTVPVRLNNNVIDYSWSIDDINNYSKNITESNDITVCTYSFITLLYYNEPEKEFNFRSGSFQQYDNTMDVYLPNDCEISFDMKWTGGSTGSNYSNSQEVGFCQNNVHVVSYNGVRIYSSSSSNCKIEKVGVTSNNIFLSNITLETYTYHSVKYIKHGNSLTVYVDEINYGTITDDIFTEEIGWKLVMKINTGYIWIKNVQIVSI